MLVIFLVIFILATIGASVWGYTLVKDRDKWDVSAKAKDAELKTARQETEWYKFQRDELLAAVGEPESSKKPEIAKAYKENREFFLKGEKFKNEEGDDEFKKLVKSFEAKLGGYNDGYKEKFTDYTDQLKARLTKAQQDYAAEVQKNNERQQEFLALQKKYAADRDAVMAEIKNGNTQIIEARKAASEAMTQTLKQNADLSKALEEKGQDIGTRLAEKDSASGLWKTNSRAWKAFPRALTDP